MVKIYPDPGPLKFSEWALDLMSPGTTVFLLVISLAVALVSCGYLGRPAPKRPDPRVERKRVFMGYNKYGKPVYDAPDPDAESMLPALGTVLGFLISAVCGALLLGQLVGLARKAVGGGGGTGSGPPPES
jgi:hypothetical protein